MTGDLEADANAARPVVAGGTGATTAAAARTALAIPHWVSIAGAPDADDDDANTGGNGTFAVGSLIYDSSGDALYVCTDASTGAAVWGVFSTGSSIANLVEDTTPQLGGPLDTNAHQVRWSKGADVASAGALTLGADGNSFDITGTTAITSIGTLGVGTTVMLQFDGALTLTHHATDLILPGGANITTAAGDIAILTEYATADWRCVSYQVAATAPGGGSSVSSFTSSAQTITAGGLLTLAHGLGAAPDLVSLRLKCIDAGGELNWVQNDEVLIPVGAPDVSSNAGTAVYVDATNVYVRYGNASNTFSILNKSDGSRSASLTNSKWNLIVDAWVFS